MAQLEGDRVTLEPSEVEIDTVVARAIALARANAPDRAVRVAHLLPTDLGSAWADLERLTETLTHLVANGIRFTPDGGEVMVTGHGDDHWIVLQVRDSGVGIASERLEQVFDGSLTMRDSRHHHSSGTLEFQSKGLGFGLPIARAIVEAHGGTIDAASTEGNGTTITLRLPRRGVEALAA
jgi:two-component system sensor histidine kinase BaeS